MSRYTVEADKEGYQVILGYDNGLETFYAQVYGPVSQEEEEEQEPCLWVGTRAQELVTVSALQVALQAYVALSIEVKKRLRRDQAASPGASPLQRSTWAMFAERSEA